MYRVLILFYFENVAKSTQRESSGFGHGVLIIEQHLKLFKIPYAYKIKGATINKRKILKFY